MTIVLMVSACVPSAPIGLERLTDPQTQASPTLVQTTAATQSTTAGPQNALAQPIFEVRLSVIRASARVLRLGSIADVREAQSTNVQVDDGIEVVKLEGQAEQSYSILDFADYIEVELFGNTSVFLKGLKQNTEDHNQATLHLDRGHMFIHVNEQQATRVTVETLYATIKTLTDGAEFDVCHTEDLTCILVKKGVIEVSARGRKSIVKAGEASYVLKEEAPSPTVCAPALPFIAWEGRYRQSADTPALDKEIAELPQKACPVTTLGLPIDAHILYRDEFRTPSSRWAQGTIDNFSASYVRFSGRRYYEVQARSPNAQYLAYVPNERDYGDVNIDIKVITDFESSEDFRYGTVFRRSGDQYYAFILSPHAQAWYFLKSSSAGLQTLREGRDERIRGLDARNALRVETYGSTFLLFINGRFIDWISDADYASGEVGLFAETLDSSTVTIRFDSIIIWNVPPEDLDPNQGKEYCFNAIDDDGDNLADRADPDCQRLDLGSIALPTNPPTPTQLPAPTRTPLPPPTNTPAQPTNPPNNTPVVPIPTIGPLPTILPPLPTLVPPLPTILPPILTLLPPLPTIQLP